MQKDLAGDAVVVSAMVTDTSWRGPRATPEGGAPFSGLLLEDAFPGPSGEWRYPRIRRRLRTADVVPAVEDASEEEEEVFFSEGRC